MRTADRVSSRKECPRTCSGRYLQGEMGMGCFCKTKLFEIIEGLHAVVGNLPRDPMCPLMIREGLYPNQNADADTVEIQRVPSHQDPCSPSLATPTSLLPSPPLSL